MEQFEKVRGTWNKNLWNGWLKYVESSGCGAIINDVGDFKLRPQ